MLYELKKAFGECALSTEIDHNLASDDGSRRNGYGRKNVTFETARIDWPIPCDRQLIARYQRWL
ncbi:hypothetical protein [Methylobacterium sp. OAE515]|uniref:hypothetical protein n=1 Tax=Methylobacterium sp. OAE515 TaxID=2817895 RepID=UPI00178A5939